MSARDAVQFGTSFWANGHLQPLRNLRLTSCQNAYMGTIYLTERVKRVVFTNKLINLNDEEPSFSLFCLRFAYLLGERRSVRRAGHNHNNHVHPVFSGFRPPYLRAFGENTFKAFFEQYIILCIL